MRIAIFSDIHGNKETLETIIEVIKKENIDEIICLGDTLGIGPNPKECMDLIINNNIKSFFELNLKKQKNKEIYFKYSFSEHIKDSKKVYPDGTEIEVEYYSKKI